MEKSVRFNDCDIEDIPEGQCTASGEMQSGRSRTTMDSVSEKLHIALESGSVGIRRITENLKSHSFNSLVTGSGKKVLDPQGLFLQRWNKLFALSCVIGISLDPLFFYVPVINGDKNCLTLDKAMETTACVLRFFIDIFYVIHILFQFRTAFIDPRTRVLGRGVLVEDTWLIAKKYLSSYFLIDILAILPLPQVVVLIIIPKMEGSETLNTKTLLKLIVFFQYLPRVIRIYPLFEEVKMTSGILTRTAWAGAAINLFLYMLASHVLGAFWYLFSVERETTCWKAACKLRTESECVLYCEDNVGNNTFLNDSCPIKAPDTALFDFGMFLDALQSGVVESTYFPHKFFYCFWWGLRNLSSLGQNLKTSTYVWEICFAVTISISGLLIFAFLIGNMQTYLQSTTTRLEEMRVKRRDTEQWMSHRLLPDNLRQRIRRYQQYKWQETRGVDEENLLCSLPKDLRRDIKRHLCFELLSKVPMLGKMDQQVKDAMCDRLKPVLYTEDSYILREGDPVDEMLFIMRGKLLTATTNGGITGFLNVGYLASGDFCGEELLTWALYPRSSSNLPISTRTVSALTEVEAFALMADDLKFVVSQFRRFHSKQFCHTFRFYSQHWRTWAACFIQAAWRRYSKKKLEESLRVEESRLQDALAKDGGSLPTLGTTVYASRFANLLRSVRRSGSTPMLQKPAEPDFTTEEQ